MHFSCHNSTKKSPHIEASGMKTVHLVHILHANHAQVVKQRLDVKKKSYRCKFSVKKLDCKKIYTLHT